MGTTDQSGEIFHGAIEASMEARNALRDRFRWFCEGAAAPVLDVGCGQGMAAVLLARSGLEVVAIDCDPDALAYARDMWEEETPQVQKRLKLKEADATDLPFPDGAFASVVLGHVLQEHPRPGDVVSEAVRVLSQDGRLFVTVPFGDVEPGTITTPLLPGSLIALLPEGVSHEAITVSGDGICLIAARTSQPAFPAASYEPMLEAQVFEQQRASAELRMGIARIESECRSLRVERRQLLEEREQLRRRIDSINQQLEAEQARAAEDSERLRDRLVELQEELGERGEIVEALEKDQVRLKEQFSRQLQDRDAKLRDANKKHRLAVEKTRELTGEGQRLKYEVDTLTWKIQSIRARKWWRIGQALGSAAKSPMALLRLPFVLLRILVRPSDMPEPPSSKPPQEKLPAKEKRSVKALLESGQYEEAVAEAERILADRPDNIEALNLRRQALAKLGDLTGVLSTARRMRALKDSPLHRRLEATTAGRVREMDVRWTPVVPGTPERLTSASKDKVLHLLKESFPYHVNGYTMRSRYTLLAQRSVGLDPVVVTSLGFPRLVGVDSFDRVEEVDGIRHHRLDLGPAFPYKATPLDDFMSRTACLAARIVQEERPALVHAGSGFRGYETALVGLALKRRFGIPLVYEVRSFLEQTWTADVGLSERGELYRMRTAAENRCMHEADAVLTIAYSMRDDLMSRGIPGSKIHVLPNGVDTTVFVPQPPDPKLQRRYGLTGRTTFGYIGNLGIREGVDVLIAGLAELHREGQSVACLLVGDGPERDRLERLARDHGIAEAVHFVGSVPHDQITDYYALIDVFCVPRKDDRAARRVTPLKPFEAMAMARPMLVSDLPALEEIVDPGSRGLSFRSADPSSLAKEARRLIESEEFRRRLGEAGREWIERERRWELNGPRYRAVYEEVLSDSSAIEPTASGVAGISDA